MILFNTAMKNHPTIHIGLLMALDQKINVKYGNFFFVEMMPCGMYYEKI